MKQEYITPETNVVEIEVAEILAVSSIDYTDKKADDEYDALSNNRRGLWGNLWE